MNTPYTLFPVSLHESYTGEASLFYDDITRFAHQLITEDFRSPYGAWMMATSRDISTLPAILGMTEAQTEEILDFPLMSPPPLNVLRFCKTLGVHPAHLLPYSSKPYTTHSPILQSMVELSRSKLKREVKNILGIDKLPDADFDECLDAFVLERRRLKELEHKATPHLRMVFDKMAALTRFDANAALDASLACHFKRALGTRASDIVEVCDMYEMFLKERKKRHLEEYDDAALRFGEVFDTMIEEGELLFGENESRHIVVNIVCSLEANPEYRTLCAESKKIEKRALIAEYLHPDFLQNALVSFVRPEHVVSRFIDLIDSYFRRKDIAKEKMAFRDGSSRVCEKFQAWRNSEQGKEELTLLANYYRIRPFLAEGAELPIGSAPPLQKLLAGHSPK